MTAQSTRLMTALLTSLVITGGAYAQPRNRTEPPPCNGQGPGSPPSVEKMMARDDADGDGAISPEEFKGPMEIFAVLDTNTDRLLSAEELQAHRPPRCQGQGQGKGQGQGMGPGQGQGPGSQVQAQGQGQGRQAQGPRRQGPPPFEEIDTDGDGQISKSEWDTHHANRRPPPQP